MGSELDRVMQKYSVPASNMAQTLGAMGRYGDSLVAHITPREALMLKYMGGSGTTNPRTGMLEFYDSDGSGNASDGGNPTGGDTGGGGGDNGGWGGGDWGGYSEPGVSPDSAIAGGYGPESPGYGSPNMTDPSNAIAGGYGPESPGYGYGVSPQSYNNESGNEYGYNTNTGMVDAPVVTTAPVTTDPTTTTPVTTAPVTTTPGTTPTPPVVPPPPTVAPTPFQYQPTYGFELNRLMQQYGVSTPTMMPFAGYTTQTTPEDVRRAEYDKNVYQTYANQFSNNMANTNMYNQAQFVPEPAKFTPQYSAPIANPAYAPTNFGGIYDTYTKYFGRNPEEAGVQYWGKTGATGDALRDAILKGAQNADLDYLRSQYPNLAPAPAPAPTPPAPQPGTGGEVLLGGGGIDYGKYFDSTPGTGGNIAPQVFVWGPDGTGYPNPLAAQRAGVTNYTTTPPMGSYARGGAVKTRYAEGGEVEGPETERSNSGPMTPEAAARAAAVWRSLLPTTNYGAQLAGAQQAARSETEAFSNMIRQMSERTESPTSRAEMYFRLASAFGAPTRTGQFTENLALAGREMGEYAKGRRTDEAERRALALRAQELRMAGARQDLASLQTLAGQESAERRALAGRIAEAQIRAGNPNAQQARIAEIRRIWNVDEPTAAGIVYGTISVVTDPVTGVHELVDRLSGQSRPVTARPAEAPTTPAAPPATGAAPPAPATGAPATGAPATGAPRGPAGESARPERTLYELASVPRTTGVLPAIGEMVQGVAGQIGANVVAPEFTERRQAFLNVQNEIIRAVINNPRFPVTEQERIRRELNIVPSMLTDPQTLIARIRALDNTLRTSLTNREREGADTSLPVAARQGARQAANEIRNLLQILGIPQGGEEPAPAPRPPRRDSLQRLRTPQQEGWSIQPIE